MGVSMSLDYQGSLRCRVEHEPSKVRLETDAPKDNMGKGETFSPTDLVGAALLTCAVTTMAIKASKENIPFSVAQGRVVKEMTASPPRRIERLSVELSMPGGLSADHRGKLEEFARTCPVALSLSKDVALPIRFHYPD